MRSEFCLVEYLSAGDRRPVKDIGVIELEPEEVHDMNRRMVWTPCRILPAKHFKAALEQE